MARTLIGAVAKALTTEYTLRRRQKIVEKSEIQKQQALNRVASGQMDVPGGDAVGGPDDDPGAVSNPGRHIRELIDQEDCGTCKTCLRRLLRRPPEGRRDGIRVYESTYQETKAAFETGEASEDELKAATREFFDTCGLL